MSEVTKHEPDEIMSSKNMQNELTKLVTEHPDTPLEEVLSHRYFLKTVKWDSIALFEYLKRPEVSAELLKLALSHDYKDKHNYTELADAAVMVLAWDARPLQFELEGSDLLYDMLKKCIDSNFYSDPKIAGYFGRIFLCYVKFTSCGILEKFPGLIPKIIEHVDILSLNMLLAELLNKYREAFDDAEFEGYIRQLAAATNTDNGYFVVSVIREILNGNKAAVIEILETDQVMRTLLESATSEKEKPFFQMFQVDLYGLIETVTKNCVAASFIVNDYQDRVKYDPKNVTPGMIAALRVFKNGVEDLFPLFFEDPPITMLNQAIMDVLDDMPKHAVKAVIESQCLAQRVMDVWDTDRMNGNVTELALFLDGKKDLSATLQTPAWKEFMKLKVAPRDALRASQPVQMAAPTKVASKLSGIQTQCSFGGYRSNGTRAGISGLVAFAEDARERQPNMGSVAPAARQIAQAPLLTQASLVTQAPQDTGSASSSFRGGLGGVHSGPSFTIPTLYQADAYTGPITC